MKKRPTGIKMMILDVDGVLTAGDIIVDDQGRESKKFHSRDGLGFYLMHRAGIRAALLSGRSAPVVEQRARQLKIDEVHQGAGDKLDVYERIREKYGLEHEEICYVGDDLIDLPVMKRVGFAAAPADAHPVVLDAAHFVSRHPGGRGAVREIVEVILQADGLWTSLLKEFDR